MKRDFSVLTKETFDLIVVGGGIMGAGTARDAALRGLNTLLLEKEDFAYGTTSRCSRLIHGGLRYLGHLDFRLVRQDMRERESLLSNAPHLVHPLAFLIPITRSSERVVMPLAMRLYDILSFDKSLPSYHRLSRREALELEPGLQLKGLSGAYLYYDCQVPFAERLCLENAISAAEHGAYIANHARVIGVVSSDGVVRGVQVKDVLSGGIYQIPGRMVVNAAGHWADQVYGMLQSYTRQTLRRTKGIHLLVPRISNKAVVLFARSDGRLLFITPWQNYSLIGTTDTDYLGDLDTVHAEANDVAYLLTEVREAFPGIQMDDVFYTTAGLRSLVGSAGKRASNVSRQHRLVDHEKREGVSGLISVLGGKLTSYRAIAEETVDLACRKLGVKTPCSTLQAPLPGAPAASPEDIEGAAKESGLAGETIAHLNSLYGSRFHQVLDLARSDARGSRSICRHSPDIVAQIWYAVREERALTAGDFLLRRSAVGLAPCQGLDAVETVSREMGRLLGWSMVEQQRQIEAYRSWVALSQQFRAGAGDHQEA